MTLSTAVIITANASQAKAEVRALAVETSKVTVATKELGAADTAVGAQVVAFENKVEALTEAVSDLAVKEQATAARMRSGLTPAMGAVGSGSVLAGNGMRGLTQQLSQVGQQTMATGQFVQALAIQLPDIGLAFGTVGTAVGLLAGIALPMVVAAFGEGEAKAKDLDGAMQDLSGSISEYQKYSELAMTSTAELSMKFGDFAGQVKGFAEYMQGVTLGKSLDDLKATIDPLKGGLADVVRQYKELDQAQAAIKSATLVGDPEQILRAKEIFDIIHSGAEESAASLGLTIDQALRLSNALDSMAGAESMSDIRDRAGEALSVLQAMVPNGAQLPGPLRDAAGALNEIAAQTAQASSNLQPAIAYAKDLGERLLYGAHVALQLAETEPRPGWLSGAIGSARLLANTLWGAVNAAAGVSGLKPTGVSGGLAQQYATYGAGRVAAEGMVGAGYGAATDSRSKWLSGAGSAGSTGSGSGRSGAASAAKQEADAVGDLIKKLEEERDLARETDPVQREMLKYRKQLAGASKEERARIEELIRAETQLKAVREASDFMASSSLDLLKDLSAGGDQAANAMKKLGNAILDAALQALVLGKGPLADLFGMSGNIFSGLFGGGGGGGGGLGALFRADGGMVFGAGGPRDDKIPMWGSAGEFMVNAKATARYRPLLEQINSGAGVPGFAAGGAIGGGAANSAFAPQRPLEIHNHIHGATGNTEIRQLVAEGVQQGISLHDREILPGRVMDVVNNQRVQGR